MRNPFRKTPTAPTAATPTAKALTFEPSFPAISPAAGFTVAPFALVDELRRDGGTFPLPPAALYAGHPAVRAVVDALAKATADLDWTASAEPVQTALDDLGAFGRLAFVTDLLVHGEAFLVGLGGKLVRVLPPLVSIDGNGPATSYVVSGETFSAASVVHVRFPNPGALAIDPRRGLSPLSSLRGVLSEDLAAQDHRTRRWAVGATPGPWVSRPLEAPSWSDDAARRFEASMSQMRSDRVPVLEESMILHGPPSDPSDGDTSGREWVLKAVAAVYGVPGWVVGATDRNADAARRALVQDAVAPLAALVTDALSRQLPSALLGPRQAGQLGKVAIVLGGIDDALRGDFSTQSAAFAQYVGGPILTPNEARALRGLPPVAGGDVLNAAYHSSASASASGSAVAP